MKLTASRPRTLQQESALRNNVPGQISDRNT
jgi:hypothetical protein